MTSPLFVRTYHPRVVDEVRQVVTEAPGIVYRWRSEGYASTAIGPHGMPGQLADPNGYRDDERILKIALWGDSQAEAVALKDEHKLFAVLQQKLAERSIEAIVYPFARSGENALTWVSQMPRVESAFSIDLHVVLIVDADDLAATSNDGPPSLNRSTRWIPDFLVQAGKNLLIDSETGSLRALRFTCGPIPKSSEVSPSMRDGKMHSQAVAPPTRNAEASATDTADLVWPATKPVYCALAPRVPEIVNGTVLRIPADGGVDATMRRRLTRAGLFVIDVSEQFLDSADAGLWPHGFDNGQIGVGHLNRVGYALIADAVSERIAQQQIDAPE